MLLSKLIKDMGALEMRGPDVEIGNLAYHSARVKPGDLFYCVPGQRTDGHLYGEDAAKHGAAALVVEHFLPLEVTQVRVEDARHFMALTAAKFFGYPAKKLKLIGVTGTNGKTTTTYLIRSIAEAAGIPCGLLGTVGYLIGNEKKEAILTTPESVDLHRMLREMVDKGMEWVVMEVAAHALLMGRVDGLVFDVAVFTNLTQDHLDFFGTMERYRDAKKILFEKERCRTAVLNADDDYARDLVAKDAYPVYHYGICRQQDVYATDIDVKDMGIAFQMHLPKSEAVAMDLALAGVFSIYNSLAAAAACYALGIDTAAIKQGLKTVKSVSGRFEVLPLEKEYKVILDYAHTPDGLYNILKTLKDGAKGRVITLFGCGGDRDRGKRPLMGEVAGKYSDFCVLTSDNPRTEEPLEIIAAIEKGLKKTPCPYTVIEDRREAIAYALHIARKDDVVLLAGKGHETYQNIKGVRHAFDEKKIVYELLAP